MRVLFLLLATGLSLVLGAPIATNDQGADSTSCEAQRAWCGQRCQEMVCAASRPPRDLACPRCHATCRTQYSDCAPASLSPFKPTLISVATPVEKPASPTPALSSPTPSPPPWSVDPSPARPEAEPAKHDDACTRQARCKEACDVSVCLAPVGVACSMCHWSCAMWHSDDQCGSYAKRGR